MKTDATGIEIYVRDCPIEALRAWVETVVGPVSDGPDFETCQIWSCPLGPVFVHPKTEDGPFIGICFHFSGTPWPSQVECARQAERELGCPVRCDPGDAYPEISPYSDYFLEIVDGKEYIVECE